MNVTLEKKEDGTGIITVNVEEQDYAAKVTSQLKEIGRTHTIPGFRKGHVSIDQLSRRFGKEVKSDVINREVIDAAVKYLEDNKVEILGQILPVEVKEINLNDKDYTFQYEVGLAPEVNVELNKDINIPFYTIEVSEEMVKEQDQAVRERFGTQGPGETVDAKAIVKGSIMELNADGTVKEGDDAIQVVDGIFAPMYFTDKAQAELFAGKKVGDKVVFNPWTATGGNTTELASMLHISKEKAEEAKGNFEINISEIIVLTPATLGEDLYKAAFGDSVKTEEEYYNALRSMIASQLAPNSQILFDRDAEKVLTEKYNDIKLPANFLKKWLVSRNEELTDANIDEEYTRMEPALKWQVIKDKIAASNDIKVEAADLESYAKMLARRQLAQYGMVNADDDLVDNFAKRFLENRESRQGIAEQVGDRKLFMCIRAKVNVEEKTVSLDEFKKLANPDAE
ncbi:MAG: trigger factor [Bacteroidales bacterium]|nr:trigger factor [Bacteroidales bacterium]MDE6801935.1 trigger factor [Muribaculaceae bacterium]